MVEYESALKAWHDFKCVKFEDYMLAYLKMDVLQLGDVYENFRKLTMKEDGLDAAHFIPISQLSLSSELKFSKMVIGLSDSPELYRFFEHSIRGVLLFVIFIG